MADYGLAPVTGGSTIDHSRKVTKIVVDPHEHDSFVIDLEAVKAASQAHSPRRENIEELRKLEKVERSKMIANNLRRFSSTAVSDVPPSLGTVASTLDGGNHLHPSAQLPESAVTPPQVRVYFDMPGLATLNYKYHGASVIPGYLVLTTDLRYSGSGEFYPFTSRLAKESDSFIGAMVDGIDSLFLLKPPTVQHKFGPYEHCLVPIAQEKPMPQELKKDIDDDKGLETSPQTDYDGQNTAVSEYKDDGVL
jgi:hypothetical protein